MTYSLLTRKLEKKGGSYATREEIRAYCQALGLSYNQAIGYLTANRYVIRILRGIFYVRSVEERKHNRTDANFLEAIKEALKIKGIKNWYLGLETAESLNNLTHEYYQTAYVISDSIQRPRTFEILGHRIKFIKVNRKLFGYGVIKKGVPYSDPEKTLLDYVYLGRYGGNTKKQIDGKIADIYGKCKREKLVEYSKHYPKTLEKYLVSLDGNNKRIL